MAINPTNGDIAYIAGAFIVIYGVKSSKQEKFLKLERCRPFQCLTYSKNGDYFAACEASLKQPDIVIWQVTDSNEYVHQYTLSGHKFGVQSIKFSPNTDYLISLGDANDRGLFVWDFKSQKRVSSNKLGKLVNAFAFEQSQKYFVTAGYSHLKFWYFDENGKVKIQNGVSQQEGILES